MAYLLRHGLDPVPGVARRARGRHNQVADLAAHMRVRVERGQLRRLAVGCVGVPLHRIWARLGSELVCGMQALDARGARTARAVQAETLAWLAEAGQRLAQLRDLHGRQPREGEWGLILDGPA
jgi:hypothetical protein